MKFLTGLTAAFVLAAAAFCANAEGTGGKLGYKEGLYFQSEDGKFKIKQNLIVKFRADVYDQTGSDAQTDFMVRRVKLKFSGHAYEKWLKYKISLAGNAGRSNKEDDLTIEDAFIVFAASPAADLKIGRYKIPFEREILNSSSSLQFVDRSPVKEFVINADRADGISVGGIMGDMFAYRVGLFQYDDEKFSGAGNMLFAGRIQANICCGKLKYSSGSFTSGGDYKIAPNFAKAPIFAVALGGFYFNGEDEEFADGNDSGTSELTRKLDLNSTGGVTADLIAKYEWANLEAAFYYGSTKKAAASIADGPDGAANTMDDIVTLGTSSLAHTAWRIQGGFFLTPKIELATRWAMADYDKASDENDKREWSAALNFYIAKHRAKIQFDYTRGSEEGALESGGDRKTNAFRAQVQLSL